MYAGALGDNAVERYAMFLISLELSADPTERRLALTRARDHGLDMHRVAVATAERTLEKAFSVSPDPLLVFTSYVVTLCAWDLIWVIASASSSRKRPTAIYHRVAASSLRSRDAPRTVN